MQKLIMMIKRAPNYMASFGVLRGLRLLFKIEGGRRNPSHMTKGKESGADLTVYITGEAAPIYLRDRNSDRSIFWQIYGMQQYQLKRYKQYQALREKYEGLLQAGQTPLIIDGGANIGLSTRWLATEFPRARVVAIEPSADNFRMLVKNTAHLGNRVILKQGGLWSRSCDLEIINPDVGDTSFVVAEAKAKTDQTFPAFGMEALLDEYGDGDAGLLMAKLDIEGSQKQLFTDPCDWVQQTGVIILELDDWLFPWQGTSQSFFVGTSKQASDYLLHGENIVWFNHGYFTG